MPISATAYSKDNVHIDNIVLRDDNPFVHYVIERSPFDRRVMQNIPLPYVTEEGLVLVDRRECKERRSEMRKH